jgi:hypothetical protein
VIELLSEDEEEGSHVSIVSTDSRELAMLFDDGDSSNDSSFSDDGDCSETDTSSSGTESSDGTDTDSDDDA